MEINNKHLAIGAVLLLLFLVLIFAFNQKVKIIDKYNVLMRSSSLKYSTRTLDKIKQIVVHHSASIGQKAEDYARYHVLSRGWAGIGYHFVIEKDGTIIQGNPLTNISYNVAGENTQTVAICLSGNFEEEQPSKAQLKSLDKLIPHVRKILSKNLPVSGHREHGQTSCPGEALFDYIQKYKAA